MVSLPFADRAASGRALAEELTRQRLDRDGVVLGLARGGVPVAFEIADRLRLPLDVVVARKVGVPWQPELAMGAVAGMVQVLERRTVEQLGVATGDIENVMAHERMRMSQFENLYRGGESPLDLQGKSATLVDDGIATGSTMTAAARHLRSLNPEKIIIAVPVGSEEACNSLRAESDEVICLAMPHPFRAVSEWYRDFRQVGDVEVQNLLAENRRRS